jgi:hypothetical protein
MIEEARQQQRPLLAPEQQLMDAFAEAVDKASSAAEQTATSIEQALPRAALAPAAVSTQQETIAQLARDCNQGDQMEKRLPIRTVASRDPNAKVGPLGRGDEHYIAGVEPLRYAVLFENVETATAPAQTVLISDALDANAFALDSFRLELITFGDRQVPVSTGPLPYVQEIDLRPQQDLILRISAELDLVSGHLTVTFISLDPATGDLPEDPFAGFLPPNVDGSGEGSIVFSVMPKAGLASGTVIRNGATIVFDDNEPILTNQWSNTVDGEAPASQVHALDDTQPAATFEVRWSGSDAGSSVSDYSVFVSHNGGPWQPWLSNTTATAALYQATAGGAYAFYTIARDRAGNVEAPPAAPDASTWVSDRNYLPFLRR